MRRRRHVLQVSTSPFLAVLLCTMGSLLMLLLIIDRRAKIAARNKALVQAAKLADEGDKAAEELAKENAARLAHQQSRKDTLHAELDRQHHDLVSQVEAAREKAQAAETNANTVNGRRSSLQQQLHAEIAALERAAQALSDERRQIITVKQQAGSSQTALAKMTADLESLEQSLADLKAARKRQQSTYSLVPYKGKRGDTRRPLYVECTELGLVFHPDRKLIIDSGSAGPQLRAEVEIRFEKQKETVKSSGPRADQTPYLFLLVRPNGITSYYRLLAALRGVPVEFGYEFVESNWVFDFTEDNKAAANSSWQTDESPREPNSSRASTSPIRPGLGKPVFGLRPGNALVGGNSNRVPLNTDTAKSGRSAFDQTGLSATPQLRSPIGQGNDNRGGTSPEPQKGSGFGSPLVSGNKSAAQTTGTGFPSRSGDGTAPFAGTQPGAERYSPTGDGNGSLVGSANPKSADGEKRGDFRSIGEHPGDSSPRRNGDSFDPRQNEGSGGGQHGLAGKIEGEPAEGLLNSKGETRRDPGNATFAKAPTQPGGGVRAGALSASTSSSSEQPPDGSPVRNPAGPSKQTRHDNDGSELTTPLEIGTSGGSPMNQTGQGQRAEGNRTNSLANGGGHAGPGTNDEPEEGGSLAGLPPILGVSKSAKKPAGLPRLTGNRDWIIPVECKANGVSLPSANVALSRTDLAQDPKKVASMLQAIERTIERRQAAVRPGEPAFRPQLRFIVEAAGLRTYHLAYPILETLKLPMTRQDVEPPSEEPRTPFPVR
ncbi:MAG: hypothetical protein ACJ8FY_04745 [Gemmataceae bacterium]